MTKFDQFVQDFVDGFSAYLPEEYRNAKIWAEKVTKTNDQIYTGINIRREGDVMSPRIYVDGLYDRFRQGMSMEEVFYNARNDWEWALRHVPELDYIQNLMNDPEQAKKQISFRLINREENLEYLYDRPYMTMADLACVYQLEIGKDQRAAIDYERMDKLGLTLEELHELAMKNTPELLPLKIERVGEALGIGTFERDLIVIGNTDSVDGAAAVLYPGVQERLEDMLNGDFWILPCSIHEVLAAKKEDAMPLEHLQAIVREINGTSAVMRKEDILSNEVYSLKDRELSIARPEPMRQKESPGRDDDAR